MINVVAIDTLKPYFKLEKKQTQLLNYMMN